MSTRPPRLAALTGLRFVAATGVVLYHYRLIVLHGSGPVYAFTPLNIIAQGHLGVSFFFLLSGFTLLYTYGNYDSPAGLERRHFWQARLARIYPLYLLGLAVGAVPFFWYYSHISPGPWVVFALSLFLLQSWLPSASNTWNSPGWSLSDEAFFYALFPWLRARLLARSTRALLAIMILSWCVLTLLPAFIAAINAAVGGPFGGDAHNFLTREPPLRLPEFVTGVALGVLFARVATGSSSARRPRRWARIATPAAILATMGVLTLPVTSWLPAYIGPYTIADPAFLWLIYAVVRYESLVTRLLSTRVMVLLGEASYALYILHFPLLYIVGAAWTRTPAFPGDNPFFLLAYLAIALGLSIFCYLRIEQPVRRRLLATFAGRHEATASRASWATRISR